MFQSFEIMVFVFFGNFGPVLIFLPVLFMSKLKVEAH